MFSLYLCIYHYNLLIQAWQNKFPSLKNTTMFNVLSMSCSFFYYFSDLFSWLISNHWCTVTLMSNSDIHQMKNVTNTLSKCMKTQHWKFHWFKSDFFFLLPLKRSPPLDAPLLSVKSWFFASAAVTSVDSPARWQNFKVEKAPTGPKETSQTTPATLLCLFAVTFWACGVWTHLKRHIFPTVPLRSHVIFLNINIK